MTRKRRLTIVRAGSGDIAPEAVEDLARRLAHGLNLRVSIEPEAFLPDVDADLDPASGSGQRGSEPPPLSSNDVVDALIIRFADDAYGWVLGLTAHDLMARGRSCVFGEATVGGRWALISAARFGPPATASPKMLERLYKEAVHEIGHLAGLGHCSGAEECAMRPAGTVSAIDARTHEFCDHCAAEFLRMQVEG